MNNERHEISRVEQLYAEYDQLQPYLDQAFKDKDQAKITEIQEQRKILSDEIAILDPTFGEKAA